MGSPAAVDGPGSSVYLLGVIADQEHHHLSDIFGLAELLRGLLGRNQFLCSLVSCDFLLLGYDLDLSFDQRSQHKARTDGVDGDTLLGVFKGDGFGEPNSSVFGSHVGRLVD